MPTIETEVNISADFEVYCGICGAGCCGDTDVYRGTRVTITCSSCESTIADLEKEKNQLETECDALTELVEELKLEVHNLS